MEETVIAAGARTVFGKFGGVFKEVEAVELGAVAIAGALRKALLDPADVDEVVMGMVLQAGAGQIPSRQASRLAGLDWQVPSQTINKVCASGFRAITLADQIIRAEGADILVAGGMECMSQTPYAAVQARWGQRMGDGTLTDLLIHDGLRCAFAGVHMGAHGSRSASEYGISRGEQDEWALRSHMRAVQAARQGKLSEEIVPVTVAGKNGAFIAEQDEGPRADTDAAKLAKLHPAFEEEGTITAGNAPGISDGAAALLLTSKRAAAARDLKSLATIVGHAAVGLEASKIADAPALAIRKLLSQTGKQLQDIDLFEVNEAFAAVVLTSGKLLGWNFDKVNVNGGAIALGHPIGASGARIVLALANELKRRGGGLGVAAICSGGAQGDAMLIRVDG